MREMLAPKVIFLFIFLFSYFPYAGITNPYVAHALFANRREPTPLDDEPTLLD